MSYSDFVEKVWFEVMLIRSGSSKKNVWHTKEDANRFMPLLEQKYEDGYYPEETAPIIVKELGKVS